MTHVGPLLVAVDLQAEVGRRVRRSQLRLPSNCQPWTVGEVLSHSIGVTLKFAEFARGDTDQPHAPQGDLLGSDHVASLRRAAEVARTAWASADMDRRCCLPFGCFSADEAAGINLFDVLAHTWDVTSVTGVPLECADELWEASLDAALAVIGPARDVAHYGAPLACSPTDGPEARFLSFLGRDPRAPAT